MEKLCYDELVLIIISIREQHKNEMKIVEEKYNALSEFCKEEKEITLLESGTCSCCGEVTSKICEDSEDNPCCFYENFVKCSGCNIVICERCAELKQEMAVCIVEYRGEISIPNKFWCKKCHDFKQKIKELK